jgi:transcriptional regulator NrdR family protein
MLCPKCKNKEFEPTKDVGKPLKVIRTEDYPRFNLRTRICLQCGYRFKTTEKYEGELKISQTHQEAKSE